VTGNTAGGKDVMKSCCCVLMERGKILNVQSGMQLISSVAVVLEFIICAVLV